MSRSFFFLSVCLVFRKTNRTTTFEFIVNRLGQALIAHSVDMTGSLEEAEEEELENRA
jgi:hypothetical protein